MGDSWGGIEVFYATHSSGQPRRQWSASSLAPNQSPESLFSPLPPKPSPMTWYAMPMPGISLPCHFMPKLHPIHNPTDQINSSAAFYQNMCFNSVMIGISYWGTFISRVLPFRQYVSFLFALNVHVDGRNCENHNWGEEVLRNERCRLLRELIPSSRDRTFPGEWRCADKTAHLVSRERERHCFLLQNLTRRNVKPPTVMMRRTKLITIQSFDLNVRNLTNHSWF